MSDTLILVWLIALSVAAVVLFLLNHLRRRKEWEEWRYWVAGDKAPPTSGQGGKGVLLDHMKRVEAWINCADERLKPTDEDGKRCPWPKTQITPPPKVPKTP
jgi:hypothetical protein